MTGSSSSQIDTMMVEAIDEKNKSLTYKVLDGEVKKEYKSFKFTVQVIGKSGGEGSIVKSTIECEKLNKGVPDPNKYAEFTKILLKNLDTYLINNA